MCDSKLPEPALKHLFKLIAKINEDELPPFPLVDGRQSPANNASNASPTGAYQKLDEDSAIFWLEMYAHLTIANQNRVAWCW